MVKVLRIDELDTIRAAGINWRPVRRALGVTAFGVNAYTADAGERLIEEHDETGTGAGRHEELYVVIAGHARFTVDHDQIDAPVGTMVFVPEIASRRAAVASADATTVLVIGGDAGSITPSAWEHSFAAQPLADAGNPREAYELAAAGLADHADSASLHYNLACYASLGGEADRAIEHLERAFALDPVTRTWAAGDSDLDAVRSHPRYPGELPER